MLTFQMRIYTKFLLVMLLSIATKVNGELPEGYQQDIEIDASIKFSDTENFIEGRLIAASYRGWLGIVWRKVFFDYLDSYGNHSLKELHPDIAGKVYFYMNIKSLADIHEQNTKRSGILKKLKFTIKKTPDSVMHVITAAPLPAATLQFSISDPTGEYEIVGGPVRNTVWLEMDEVTNSRRTGCFFPFSKLLYRRSRRR